MTLEGTVVNGMVVLDNPKMLPEGARVQVSLTTPAPEGVTLQEILLKSAGRMTDLPPDFAEQHDHHIRGTPKR